MEQVRQRRAGAALVAVVLLTLAGCGGNPRPVARTLEEIAGSIARSEGVDREVVLSSLADQAATKEGQLSLARKWEGELSRTSVSDFAASLDEIPDVAREVVQDAVCETVADALADGKRPDGKTFLTNVTAQAASRGLVVPGGQLQGVIDDMDSLAEPSSTPDEVRFRLISLKWQYC